MSGTVHKELRPYVKAARKAGWRERESNKGIVLYPPDGSSPITVHGSPNTNRRGLANHRAQFRRAGLDV